MSNSLKFWSVLVLLCVVQAIPGGVFGKIESQGMYKFNANVREAAGMSTILGVLPVGSEVDILEEQAGWYHIKHQETNLEGWTASWIVERKESAPAATQAEPAAPTASAEKRYGVVQRNSNVRTGPMQTVLAVLPEGTRVEILAEENGWSRIVYEGEKEGWIASWLLEPSIDKAALNEYWLAKVNELRQVAGLPILETKEALLNTAATWAAHLASTGQITHTRPDGSSAHSWIAKQGIAFTERYAPGGWKTNYFTENIGFRYSSLAMAEAKLALDSILASYLAEAPWNGAHYQTLYHPDWNSVGAGFSFDPLGNGKYKLYAVFHYGSLP